MRLVSGEIGILCRIFGQIQHILPSGYINFPSFPSVLKSLVPELLVGQNGAIYSKETWLGRVFGHAQCKCLEFLAMKFLIRRLLKGYDFDEESDDDDDDDNDDDD
jgi:hypothetical protein